MKLNLLKKVVVGMVFGLTVLFSGGATLGTAVQAQNRDRDRGRFWQPGDNNQRRDGDRDWNRDRGRRDRDWDRDRRGRVFVTPRPRVFVPPARVYTYPRTYPYGGGVYRGGSYGGSYGSYGGSYEEQRGYRDGLDRGQEDARDRRSFNPNNSSHYRSGNGAYREGFRRGYQVGYRQFGGRGW